MGEDAHVRGVGIGRYYLRVQEFPVYLLRERDEVNRFVRLIHLDNRGKDVLTFANGEALVAQSPYRYGDELRVSYELGQNLALYRRVLWYVIFIFHMLCSKPRLHSLPLSLEGWICCCDEPMSGGDDGAPM